MTNISKAIGIPDRLDVEHTYAFYTMEYGVPRYWYVDQLGNYWAYSNAPENDPDHNFHLGEPLLDLNQPLPHTDVAYFTELGLKRNRSVPEGIQASSNPQYDNKNPSNLWYEFIKNKAGKVEFIYLDADVKENPFMWAQQQLRAVDASLDSYRKYAASLFTRSHPKDKNLGVILLLVDQGLFTVEQLVSAAVQDLSFSDKTVILLNKKFLCDDQLYDYLTGLSGKDPASPLFEVDTNMGKAPFGLNFVYSCFYSVFTSPVYLKYWHANNIFSRSLTRFSLQQVPISQAVKLALSDVSNALATAVDPEAYVDPKLKKTLMDNYKQSVTKALPVAGTDAVCLVDSALQSRKQDELQFSEWLHSTPMHIVTPEEEEAMDEYEMEEEQAASEAGAEEKEPGTEAPKEEAV